MNCYNPQIATSFFKMFNRSHVEHIHKKLMQIFTFNSKIASVFFSRNMTSYNVDAQLNRMLNNDRREVERIIRKLMSDLEIIQQDMLNLASKNEAITDALVKSFEKETVQFAEKFASLIHTNGDANTFGKMCIEYTQNLRASYARNLSVYNKFIKNPKRRRALMEDISIQALAIMFGLWINVILTSILVDLGFATNIPIPYFSSLLSERQALDVLPQLLDKMGLDHAKWIRYLSGGAFKSEIITKNSPPSEGAWGIPWLLDTLLRTGQRTGVAPDKISSVSLVSEMHKYKKGPILLQTFSHWARKTALFAMAIIHLFSEMTGVTEEALTSLMMIVVFLLLYHLLTSVKVRTTIYENFLTLVRCATGGASFVVKKIPKVRNVHDAIRKRFVNRRLYGTTFLTEEEMLAKGQKRLEM